MHTSTTAPQPAARDEPIPFAILRGERVLVASAALASLTGYTRAEITSPEFRLAHLFARGEPAPGAPPPPGETIAHATARLEPLRGTARTCAATTWRLDDRAPPLVAVLLRPLGADAPHGPPDAAVVGRELVRACRSHFAETIVRMRRMQLEIETIEHAHPEVVAHETKRLGPVFEHLQRLDEEVDALARAAAWGRG